MKVSLDVTTVPPRPAGAGRYIFELARGLAGNTEFDITFFSRKDDAFRWEALGVLANMQAVAPSSRPARLAWEQLRLPSTLNSAGIDVHHAPHYTMPERAKLPVVVTIHDMTFFDHPEWHERSKVFLFRRAIATAVKRATHLIAVSNDTATRLKQRFGDVNVTVIPHGIDHARFNTVSREGERDELAAAGIPQNFIAFVGTIEPRKNIPQLIRAFDLIAPRHPDLHLVIAGQRGWQLDEFDNALASATHKDRIVVPGYLSEPLVPALLRHARAVAYPSHVEGFGLPALEALACGAPLVAAKGSAVEEVVGDAGILINSDDVDELASALEQAIEEVHGKGMAVAANYTWTSAVTKHIEVYRRVVKG